MRSGSTLLKALLGEADDVSHINEYNFQTSDNKYASYFSVYRLSPSPIIVLKHPASYDDVDTYPILPKYEHKKIILIRQPLETIASIEEMNSTLNKKHTIHVSIQYWIKTYEKLLKHVTSTQKCIIVRYSDIINSPIQTTKSLFSFINSRRISGVDTYSSPLKGSWEWGKDDGSHLIKSKKIMLNTKSYPEPLRKRVDENFTIKQIKEQYKLYE